LLESFFRATFLLDPEGWNESMSEMAMFHHPCEKAPKTGPRGVDVKFRKAG
jgi:hypothetical protein